MTDYLVGQCNTEMSIGEGEEAARLQDKISCKKNPGHEKFKSLDDFQIQHLPEGHRDQELYELIRSVADITVKVYVKWVSSERPKFWPGKKDRYPLHVLKSRNFPRQGTGEVDKVIKFSSGVGYDHQGKGYHRDKATCPCRKCLSSENPRTVWWEIYIDTAAHVVFDDVEASHTSCRLFYDRHDSPVVTVDNVSVSYVNVEGDWCVLRHVTCDEEIAGRMHRNFLRWVELRDSVYKRYGKISNKLAFIVSHPHGSSKHVSIGEWTENKTLGEYKDYILSHLYYTIPTCPGSSGATIHCVGNMWDHLHSRVHEGSLNYSSTGAVLEK